MIRSAPAPDNEPRPNHREIRYCLAPDEERLVVAHWLAAYPEIRFVNQEPLDRTHSDGPEPPPLPVYRKPDEFESHSVIGLFVGNEWRPAWRFNADAYYKHWEITNLGWPRFKYVRSSIVPMPGRLVRDNRPLTVIRQQSIRVSWERDFIKGPAICAKIFRIIKSSCVREMAKVVINSATDYMTWRGDDQNWYGKDALAWAGAAPRRLAGWVPPFGSLPVDADPFALGFRASNRRRKSTKMPARRNPRRRQQ